jgi:hypothetical protein
MVCILQQINVGVSEPSDGAHLGLPAGKHGLVHDADPWRPGRRATSCPAAPSPARLTSPHRPPASPARNCKGGTLWHWVLLEVDKPVGKAPTWSGWGSAGVRRRSSVYHSRASSDRPPCMAKRVRRRRSAAWVYRDALHLQLNSGGRLLNSILLNTIFSFGPMFFSSGPTISSSVEFHPFCSVQFR